MANMLQYQGYKPGKRQQPLPPQMGMHVVNQTMPRAGLSAYSMQAVAQGAPHSGAGVSQNPSHAYGPPDPWYTNLIARKRYEAGQGGGGGDGSGTTGSSSGNAWLDSLRDNINTQIRIAQQNALANKKDILLGFGSQQLARELLGGGNDAFINTISDNPDTGTSWLAKENFATRMNRAVTNENLNAANLFYSGARIVGLQNVARQHLLNVDEQSKAVRSAIAKIQQDLLARIAELNNQFITASQPGQAGS